MSRKPRHERPPSGSSPQTMLAKIVALWRSTQHDGERQAARGKAETLCRQLGVTFEDAVSRAIGDDPPCRNVFAGFDDLQEAKQAGWKAARAREKAEKVAARENRREAAIKRHGSPEAALEPCERERRLVAAVGAWRKPCDAPHGRWTDSVDGWREPYKSPPQRVAQALREAYALPSTFAEARAEFDYWRRREQELSDLLRDEHSESMLDLVAAARMRILEQLIERELTVKTAADLLDRFRHYRDRETSDFEAETRIFHDLENLVASAAAHPSNVDTSPKPSSAHDAGHIRAAIEARPSRSDRSIASELRRSPTTVGRVRRSLGLGEVRRSVQRGGQIFEARYAPRAESGRAARGVGLDGERPGDGA